MEEIAYAKINLALHVRAREADGYHRIETLFVFAEDGDILRVGPGDGLSLTLEGRFAAALPSGVDNLVMAAALALAERYGVTDGASLVLDKRLPVAAGIGGGSADAAAAVRLLDRWWGLAASERDLVQIGRALGADVPACLASRTAIGTGRGDDLVPVADASLSGAPLLLVNPMVAVSTVEVFGLWNGRDGGPLPAAALPGRNDLLRPALRVAPAIAEVLAVLEGMAGAAAPSMSGSGATCFALFETAGQRDAARQAIAESHPHWWRLATRLR